MDIVAHVSARMRIPEDAELMIVGGEPVGIRWRGKDYQFWLVLDEIEGADERELSVEQAEQLGLLSHFDYTHHLIENS